MKLLRVVAAQAAKSCAVRGCLRGVPSTSFATTVRQITTSATMRASAKEGQKSAWTRFTRRVISNMDDKRLATALQDSSWRDLGRLLKLAWPYRARISVAMGCLCVSSTIYLSFPRILAYLFDESNKPEGLNIAASPEETGNRFGPKVVSYVKDHIWVVPILLAAGAVTICVRIYLMHTASQLIINDLRKKVFRSLVNQDMAFYDKNQVGEIVSRLGSDALIVGNSVSSNLSDGTRALVGFIGSCTMMYITSPYLTTASAALGPLLALVFYRIGKLLNKYARQMQLAIAKSNQHATERLSNMRTVKSLVSEEKEVRSYDRIMQTVWEVAKREGFARGAFYGSLQLTGYGTITGLLYLGSDLISQGQLTYGGLSAFVIYFFMGFGSLSTLGTFYGDLMRGLGASTRLFEMAKSVPSIARTGGRKIDGVRKGITFESVGFTYPSRVHLFTDISFHIPAGKITAIVGSSGCGKSTVGSLLLRLYDPTEGRILVDDVDLRELDPSNWRSLIGTVGQDPVLFSTSIRDNICYGSKEPEKITDEMLAETAKQSNSLEFIKHLPEGFNTVVGEHGASNLSGGQRQRVAIARALITKPKVLLLDEATSAQDATSEFLVRNALNALLADRSHTVLIIAHRLSTIKHADQILTLDKGRIVERGTFEELMTVHNGVFKSLVEKQMEGWRDNNF